MKQKAKNKFVQILKNKWFIRAVILAVIVGGIAFFALSRGGERAVNAPRTETAVVRRDIIATITGTAVIKPKDQYSVTSLVNGEIIWAGFEEGDMVNQGDVLYRIDAGDVEKNIASADVSLRKSQSNYDETLKTKTDLNVLASVSGTIKTMYIKTGDTVQSGAKIADIYDDTVMELVVPFNEGDIGSINVGSTAEVTIIGNHDTLYGTVSRINSGTYAKAGNMLVGDVVISVPNPGVITVDDRATASVGEIDCNDSGSFKYLAEKTVTAKTSGEVEAIYIREGNRVAAGEMIAALTNDTLGNTINSNALTVEDAQINKDRAMRQLDDYTILAPISGQVITKNTKAGDKLDNTNKQEAMAVIYDLSSLEFEMMIDELDINKISIGQEVKITADALDGRSYVGYIQKISIDGEGENGVTEYPVTVSIETFDEYLLPGMNIDAEITVGGVTNVLAVPKSAVTRDNIVYIPGEKGDLTDGAPEGYKSVKVEIGFNDDNYVEIISGLAEGDIVKIETINSTSVMFPGMGGGAPSGGFEGGGARPSGGGMR